MNKDSEVRVQRLETVTEKNDEIIKGLYENNERKVDEFKHYEERLD